MSYKDVENFYTASYHVGVILRTAGLATHDPDELASYGNWLITLDTEAGSSQHKNVAIYENSVVPEYSQDASNWPRENITIMLRFRDMHYMSAYTIAQKCCRAIDADYRSWFQFWDSQLSSYSNWEVRYDYGGVLRRTGPAGMERDENKRVQFEAEYTCTRRISNLNI